MRILVTGGKGMLGRTLCKRWSAKHTCLPADLPMIDITNPSAIDEAIGDMRADIVVHCAAMTAVDLCETNTDLAYRVNVIGSANVASACLHHNARLIAISTDYVFSGEGESAWSEFDIPSPRTVYGKTKFLGEEMIRRHCPNHNIARVAWLYGSGGPSFVHTMIKLAHDDPSRTLKVVDDQFGNPTSCEAVAQGLETLINKPCACGTYHMTCAGRAVSWCEFAQAIFEETGFKSVKVQPCTTEEYPRPAPRPHNSALRHEMLRLQGLPEMPLWRDALHAFCQTEFSTLT